MRNRYGCIQERFALSCLGVVALLLWISSAGALPASTSVAADGSSQTGTLTLGPSQLPGGTVNTAYSATLTASGGTAPYTFAVTDGALPTGLALDTAGGISGTPTTTGVFPFVVTATDSAMHHGTKRFFLVVVGPVTIVTTRLPDTTQGSAYHTRVIATGGSVGSYIFAVTTGSLPAGLTLNASSGAISGSATAAGVSTFTITAKDLLANAGSQQFTITVNPTGTATLVGLLLKGTVTSGTHIGDTDSEDEGDALIVSVGSVVTLATTGVYSNGSKQLLTSGVTFTSSDTAKATVDASGAVTTTAPGSVVITATDGTAIGKIRIVIGSLNAHPEEHPVNTNSGGHPGGTAGSTPTPRPNAQPDPGTHQRGNGSGTNNGGTPVPALHTVPQPNAQPNRH